MGQNKDTIKFTVNGLVYIKFHAKDFIEDAYSLFKDLDNTEGISICMSLLAFIAYSLNEMTLEFRRQVQKRVAEVKDVNRAMQFVFAFYPVAEVPKESKVSQTKKLGAKR